MNNRKRQKNSLQTFHSFNKFFNDKIKLRISWCSILWVFSRRAIDALRRDACVHTLHRRSVGHDTHEIDMACMVDAPQANKRFIGFVIRNTFSLNLQHKTIFMLEMLQLASVCRFSFSTATIAQCTVVHSING